MGNGALLCLPPMSLSRSCSTSREKRQGLKVACLEGIAYRNGWISEEKMRELAKPMLKNKYGQYLLKVIDEMKEEINSNTFTHPEMSEIKK